MNENSKAYAKRNRVMMWEVAAEMGCADTTLCKWLRTEFTPEREEAFKNAVDAIVNRKDVE